MLENTKDFLVQYNKLTAADLVIAFTGTPGRGTDSLDE